jgi:hypothetical protein
MWFTSIQISPRTIGMMVDEFHWVWATEWTFFLVEIVAGYLFYRYGRRLTDTARMTLLVTYSTAAWMSLFWINGILSWQLTPGGWLESGSVWAGFFNPSFWPSLVYRTMVSMTIAALVAMVVLNSLRGLMRQERRALIGRTAVFLAVMVPMPLIGLWYLAVLPADSRSWLMGGSAAMSMFMALTVGASTLLGLYAVLGLFLRRLVINLATSALLLALAFGATAGGEFVREGVRKPYTVRGALYSNSITPEVVQALRERGSVTDDPYPLRDAARIPTAQLRVGAKVYRLQCSVCHTIDGANGLTHLTRTWTSDQMRQNIAKLQFTKPFMPPFAGNAEELESVVQFLRWQSGGRPPSWPVSNDEDVMSRNQQWLDEAGTEPVGAHPVEVD